jgi:hypothetical protein
MVGKTGSNLVRDANVRIVRAALVRISQDYVFSVHGPRTRSGHFEQVAVGVPKVEASPARFPRTLLFHGDPSLLEPQLPGGQFVGWNAASGGALGTGVNAVTRGNEISVRPEQLLQFRMNQAALVPITLKDGHQVPPVPAPAASLDKATE